MKKHLLYLLTAFYASAMPACNLFEVRRTSDTVTISDSVLTIDSATAKADPALHGDTIAKHGQHAQEDKQNKDTALVPFSKTINTRTIQPDTVVGFAKTLIGTPYVYASVNPKVGFDCSGFITYVFNHFGIAVPRSSVDFTHVGQTVSISEARRGDLILFTGTDSTEKNVGHMGLVVSNRADDLQFIHATPGKAMGVTITPFNGYYKKRFVRIARIFP